MRPRSYMHDPQFSSLLTCLVCLVLLAACSPQSSASQSGWTRNQTLPLNQKDAVVITLDHADVSLQGTSGSLLQLEMSSNAGSADDFTVERKAGTISIEPRSSTRSEAGTIKLTVELPSDIRIDLKTRSGGIDLRDLAGRVDVETISANVTAERIDGTLWVTTPRGEVQVQDSNGEIHVLGQAGRVRLSNLHGITFASTIMGEIEYAGEPQDGDRVKLETDHARVLLRLSSQADADLQLASAGGQIVCSLPGLNEIGRDCSASLKDGSASIEVRTVSGAIRIESLQSGP